MRNTLFYGDNLDILRDHIATDSIDLVYLDPPFNSNRNYNVLFKEKSGEASPAQLEAFTDTWQWDRAAERAYDELTLDGSPNVAAMIAALRQFVGSNDMMAYLVMMAQRLVELHRVLKSTGSLYLHCDPTASHYLKIVLDAIFGPQRFLNEVTWKRSSAHSDTRQGMRRYGKIRDVLLVYTKSADYTWHPQYSPYDDDYLRSEYRHVAPSGKRYKETDCTAAKPGGETNYEWRVKRPVGGGTRWSADLEDEYLTPQPGFEYRGVRPYNGRFWGYSKENMIGFAKAGKLVHRETGMPRLMQFADEMPGVPLQDIWDDISPAAGREDLGYPTQKPLKLLERIIEASSNPDDVVLDPFCGCGTAIIAAQKLGRQWIGIDITHLSIALMKYRVMDAFPDAEFQVLGEPADEGSARMLAESDRYQFQWWALSLIKAKPLEGKEKKGADKGIDGVITFVDDASHKLKRCLVQVKSGHVSSATMRDLIGTMNREKAEKAILVTLEAPTAPMRQEAVEAGFYHSEGWGRDYPKVQILTIEELLEGKQPDMPPARQTFTQGERLDRTTHQQHAMAGLFDN